MLCTLGSLFLVRSPLVLRNTVQSHATASSHATATSQGDNAHERIKLIWGTGAVVGWLRWKTDVDVEDMKMQVRGKIIDGRDLGKDVDCFWIWNAKDQAPAEWSSNDICRRGRPQAQTICCIPRDRCGMQAPSSSPPGLERSEREKAWVQFQEEAITHDMDL